MIFSEGDHIEQIKAGTKTQTRRTSDRYEVGKLYAIQPCRTCKGIPDGKILITAKRLEVKTGPLWWWMILPHDAETEGGYTPQEYEELYEKMHPNWKERWAYLFRYYPTGAIMMMNRGEFPGFMLDTLEAISSKGEGKQ